MISRTPKPGSFSEEVEQFLATVTAGNFCARDLGTTAPRLGRRLRALDRERSAIVAALSEIPVDSRVPAPRILRRIRTLAKAENQAVFDCHWHDLGGEG